MYNGRTDLEYEDLNKLAYLEQCIREILRVYSVAQDTYRESLDCVTIDGLAIPKGIYFATNNSNTEICMLRENFPKFDLCSE